MKEALTEEDPEGPSTSAPQIRPPVRRAREKKKQTKTYGKNHVRMARLSATRAELLKRALKRALNHRTHLRVEATHRPRPGHQAQAREIESGAAVRETVGEPAETRLGHHQAVFRRFRRLRRTAVVRVARLFRLVTVGVDDVGDAVRSGDRSQKNALHAPHRVVPKDEVARGVIPVDVPFRVVPSARGSIVIAVRIARAARRLAGEPAEVGAPPEEPAARVVGVALTLEDREDLHVWIVWSRRRRRHTRRHTRRIRRRIIRLRRRTSATATAARTRRRMRRRAPVVAHADERAVDFAEAHAQGHVAQHEQIVLAGTAG